MSGPEFRNCGGQPIGPRAFDRLMACGVIALASAASLVSPQAIAGGPPVATTHNDYFQPGTQPMGAGLAAAFDPIKSVSSCTPCHANFGETDGFLMNQPYTPWAASMMGQSARDPLFYAGLTIANQDAAGAGEFCIRCHAPVGFLNGHATPTDGSALTGTDLQGVNCALCHRLVNPVYAPGVSPAQDEAILNDFAAAGLLTPEGSNARYTVDPTDCRRGPFSDIPLNVHSGDPQPQIIPSDFHKRGEFCWTCHDVSNPLISKQPDGTFALNAMDAPHPTQNQADMFPLHRTYKEWKNSYYSTIGVQHNGRFGGNHPTGVMKDCEDCHMPKVIGFGCSLEFDPFFSRPDVPQHSFIGSNYWVLNAVRTVDADNDGNPDHPDEETGLTEQSVADQVARDMDFLQKASDLTVTQAGQNIKAKIFNRTGHKLPTGFADGRRMWVNVQFLDCDSQVIQEYGAYDAKTATLTTSDTKVYEMDLGISGAEHAAAVGQPEGRTFHFMLANKILKDNRIPPAGHSNQLAIINGTAPVGASYLNGQNWDETIYPIPVNAHSALVSVNYQVTSREFIEYLRDSNLTDNRGQVAYDLWVQGGMSAPVVMDSKLLAVYQHQDIDKDGNVDVNDLFAVINAWGDCPALPAPCPTDLDANGVTDIDDLFAVIGAWGSCP